MITTEIIFIPHQTFQIHRHNSYTLSGIATDRVTSFVIPSLYNNLPVTSIGNSAFRGCTKLTSVTFPNCVTSIGSIVFYNCYNLMSIVYEGTVEEWNTISKDSMWNTYSSYPIIYCTDGKITHGTVTYY